ncbi:MAG: N-acetylmuramoyl-L-alanine amidase [Firmicutes bacterium]|nr:N-acetylmuramoyl-L-alanine amidase [Bacillota bacterium]
MMKKRLIAVIIVLCLSLSLTSAVPILSLNSSSIAYAKTVKKKASKKKVSVKKKSSKKSSKQSRKKTIKKKSSKAKVTSVSNLSFAQNRTYLVTIPTSKRNVTSVQRRIQQKTRLGFYRTPNYQIQVKVSGGLVPRVITAARQLGYRAYVNDVTPPPPAPKVVAAPANYTPPVVKVTVQTISLNTTSTATNNQKLIICIDPGHGGADSGAVTKDANGNIVLREKDVNLDVALRLRDLLKSAGHEVIMTRTTDDSVVHPFEQKADLYERAAIANRAHANIYVSIHHNASTLPAADGTEVYSYPGSPTGAMLASAIQSELMKSLWSDDPSKNRGTNTANFAVLRETVMTAALSEAAFMSNPGEAALLATEPFRQQEAQGIFNGITKYLNHLQNNQPL